MHAHVWPSSEPAGGVEVTPADPRIACDAVGAAEREAARRSLDDALRLAALARAPRSGRAYDAAKRLLDVVIAAGLMVLTSPVMALLTLLIKLDSPGPAVFTQERVGRNGRLFEFRKFRTMYVDARERFPEFYAYEYDDDEIDTMYFKLPYDPRLTRVGRWLRRTSLDELPNLLCVLRGDMSLVGPRPEIPEMLPYYEPHQYCKFAVKPGVTGLAQVSGRNILKFVETNAFDFDYVQRRSLRLDLEILGRTALVVPLMVGAH